MKSKKNTTLKDIAKELNISMMAVSKVLNNKGGISKETSKKVLKVAKRLNYAPNTIAKSLRLNRTKTISVVVSDSSHSFFAKVIKGIQDTAANYGYSVILSNTDGDREKEKEAIKVLISKRVDGMLLASSTLTKKKDMEFLKSFRIPFIFLIRRSYSNEADYVVNDNILGSYIMTDYLLKIQNSKIHFLNLPKTSPSGSDRLVGYKKALKDNRFQIDPSIIYNVKPSISEGYRKTKELLDANEKVNTVFCGCDVISIGAMQVILENGLRIPEDIRIAGYDDIDFAGYLRVPLTTIKQPKYSIGYKGVELLINKMENQIKGVQHIILPPELIIRQSA